MIEYVLSPQLSNLRLNELFATAWENHETTDLVGRLRNCALWVCTYDSEKLVGFVKIVWDGGKHGFVLDTTTHSDYQRRGVASELLRKAAEASKEIGTEWLHADFESNLTELYRSSGYRRTEAGLLNLRSKTL